MMSRDLPLYKYPINISMHNFSKNDIKKLILCILINFWVRNLMVVSISEKVDSYCDVTGPPGSKMPQICIN